GPPARIGFTLFVVVACMALALMQQGVGGELLLGVAVVFWVAVVPFWLRRTLRVNPLALAAAGAVVLISAWYSLYVLQETAARLLALLGVVWIADTAAYFAGRRFGRRKLAPSISPGKTWEG